MLVVMRIQDRGNQEVRETGKEQTRVAERDQDIQREKRRLVREELWRYEAKLERMWWPLGNNTMLEHRVNELKEEYANLSDAGNEHEQQRERRTAAASNPEHGLHCLPAGARAR